MHRQLKLDFRTIQSELAAKPFISSSEFLGPVEDVFKTKEHGYRRIDQATFLHILNFEACQTYSLAMTRPDLVCIQLTIAGTYSRNMGDHCAFVDRNTVQITNYPSSASYTAAGTRLRGIMIVCERQHLLSHFGLRTEHIAPTHRPIFTSRMGAPHTLDLPMSRASLLIADQILSCRYGEPLRGVFMSAKGLELVCGIVSQINAMPAGRAPRIVGASSKLAAIGTAAEIYRREPHNPPTIAQLAQRVGLNRNDLTDGFKKAFGLTPHAYGHMARMEEAERLLRTGEISISEVARRIGYDGYSSFSRAYHAHFGRAPSSRHGT
ncbi:AraC family transcriptional regulator [Xanthobacter sp.]|uniref:helix-turn-helix transcriptional regulator n=1 Tax=Xanthobacter sp. TaxID=35809 RepID=UPI0025CCE726|nr:AraC family transcriptional regulator [Xanthobacter sp.]